MQKNKIYFNFYFAFFFLMKIVHLLYVQCNLNIIRSDDVDFDL